jgi:hypothetical protein
VDLFVFALLMLALAAHATTHRSAGRLGRGGEVCCVWFSIASAVIVVLFGLYSYFRSTTEWGGVGPQIPIALAQAVGLTGLAFLPLLHSPESDLLYNMELVRKSYVNKLTPGRSLIPPAVAVFTFFTLPSVFKHFSFLANSDIHVDSRLDLSDPEILGAPCSAVTGAATLSSYIDSSFYAALLGLVFFFPLLDTSTTGQSGNARQVGIGERKSNWSRFDAAVSLSLCFALTLFVVRAAATKRSLNNSVLVVRPRPGGPMLCVAGLPSLVRRGTAPEHHGALFSPGCCNGPLTGLQDCRWSSWPSRSPW